MTGQQLRRLRRGTLNLTQAELAEKLGITPRSISTYENMPDDIPKIVAAAANGLAGIIS